MEEEIDLRPYIRGIMHYRYWILGTTIIAALVTFFILSLLPPTYEATAFITIINPQTVRLESLTDENVDPRFSTINENDPLTDVYPELATSDALLQELLNQIGSQLDNVETVDDLRSLLKTQQGNNPSLLKLTAQYRNSNQAALIVNTWAELFVPWANELYGQKNLRRTQNYESQLAQATVAFENAENTLIEFQGENHLRLLAAELTSAIETQSDYLIAQRRVRYLLQDAANLHNQIITQSGVGEITLVDQLTALNLQLRTFNIETTMPLEVQIPTTNSLIGENRQAQLAFLDNLILTLERYAAQIETRLMEIEPEILSLQQQSQEAEIKNNRLIRNLFAAEEEYTALTRVVVEERISAQNSIGGVQLVSQSAIPDEPESRGRLLNTAITGAVTFFLGIFLVIIATWWQQMVKEKAETENE